MPHRDDAFRPGEYYHVYNRATKGGLLFFEADNYEYCLRLLGRAAPRDGVALVGYCLMPNHYHLLLRQDGDRVVSVYVNAVFGAYGQALNRRRGRVGPLCEGRFRHVHVDRDEYLVHLLRYIHLNPVKAGLASGPEDWPYSDYRMWCAGDPKDATAAGLVDGILSGQDYRVFVESLAEEVAVTRRLSRYILE